MHPDLTISEFAAVVRLAKVCESKIKRGEIPDPDTYHQTPYEEERIERLYASVRHLRGILEAKGLAGWKK